MTSEYENLFFIELENRILAIKNKTDIKFLFNTYDVAPQYLNLLTASPAMYKALHTICVQNQRLVDVLEQNATINAEREAIDSVISFLSTIQEICMASMRLAEIGGLKLDAEINAEIKSKIPRPLV